MARIVPHFWFASEAKEAAELYVSLFAGSSIDSILTLPGTPGGDSEGVRFTLAGQPFAAISAGPLFTLNPSISLQVYCSSKEEVRRLWAALKPEGKELMELGAYTFSPLYGWIQDRYGLSWQLLLVDDEIIGPKIKPSLLFSGRAWGKAERAIHYYTQVFPDAKLLLTRHNPLQEDKLLFGSFRLAETDFAAMDHSSGGDFTFNEGISLMVLCRDQAEIDYYWQRLSAVPEAEQCGWLQDAFGLSWQIVPATFDEILEQAGPEERQRMIQAFLPMKKLDIAAIEAARRGHNTTES